MNRKPSYTVCPVWESVSPDALARFVRWHQEQFGRQTTPLATFHTCTCGYFHVSPYVGTHIIRRMQEAGLIRVDCRRMEVTHTTRPP